jgi:HPt (histidine-containing phosphotransfer) domain-containing protein
MTTGAILQTKTSSDQHIYQHIDPSVLDGIRAQLPGRPELIGRIVASFLQSSPMLLDNIRMAVQSGDAEAVRISAHTMKSSNAQVGATRLAEICQELESLATAKHLAGTNQPVDRAYGKLPGCRS